MQVRAPVRIRISALPRFLHPLYAPLPFHGRITTLHRQVCLDGSLSTCASLYYPLTCSRLCRAVRPPRKSFLFFIVGSGPPDPSPNPSPWPGHSSPTLTISLAAFLRAWNGPLSLRSFPIPGTILGLHTLESLGDGSEGSRGPDSIRPPSPGLRQFGFSLAFYVPPVNE